VIYLILKIFFYLLMALLAGVAAGWLSRNIVAARREDELSKLVTEARSRVPQFESLMRARDQQVQRLKDENGHKDKRIAELLGQAQALEDDVRNKHRQLKQVTARNEALELAGDGAPASAGATAGTDAAVDELTDALARTRDELARARRETADAVAEAAAAEAELARLRAGGTASGVALGGDPASAREVEELRARLRQTGEEQSHLNKALESERRRIVELERERELQNRSLRVLHEQLELERERNAVPGDQPAAQRGTGH